MNPDADLPPPAPEPENPNAKHARKRTSVERARDMVFIEHWHVQKKTASEIAELLNKERAYSLTDSQIRHDLRKLEAMWMAEAKASVDKRKMGMLLALDKVEAEAWAAWDRSKQEATKQIVEFSGGASPLDDEKVKKLGGEKRAFVRESRTGEAHYLKVILDVHDRRARLLGLDAPAKVEHSGDVDLNHRASGAELSADMKDRLLSRHYERIQRARVIPGTDTLPGAN